MGTVNPALARFAADLNDAYEKLCDQYPDEFFDLFHPMSLRLYTGDGLTAVFYEEGILHYCVDNIPSAFSKTSSVRFSNDSLPFAMEVADKGVVQALKDNKHLRRGLTTYKGVLTMVETGIKQNRPYTEPDEFVKNL